jgi:hypothetical protein
MTVAMLCYAKFETGAEGQKNSRHAMVHVEGATTGWWCTGRPWSGVQW